MTVSMSQLRRMGELEEGWNGYKAPPPSRLAVDNARAFICSVEDIIVPRRVAPSAIGGVGVTFRIPGVDTRKVYIEFLNSGDHSTLFSGYIGEIVVENQLPCGSVIVEYLNRR